MRDIIPLGLFPIKVLFPSLASVIKVDKEVGPSPWQKQTKEQHIHSRKKLYYEKPIGTFIEPLILKSLTWKQSHEHAPLLNPKNP